MPYKISHMWSDTNYNHMQVLKSEHQNLRQESVEYRKCVLDASQMSAAIQQYGMFVVVKP
jgi:hypothetical protein